ncbi:MAG: EVE domain-containing protein [Verrucomicrobia bacterium]|nr:EVE domain-containing protein [Verrucomicrobiota bacterium]MCH8510686.1 EVE domain-containing protein [Kiritimatiellia bacterium]
MAKKKHYWLMKSEPDAYSIDDLERDGREPWNGIRNYQARNFLRDDMKEGDLAFFYHSNAKPPGIVGVMKIDSGPEPDRLAFDENSAYFDPKSDPEDPRWIQRQVRFVAKLPEMVTLEEMKRDENLEGMLVTRRGQRLSIQPVDANHFRYLCKRGGLKTIPS